MRPIRLATGVELASSTTHLRRVAVIAIAAAVGTLGEARVPTHDWGGLRAARGSEAIAVGRLLRVNDAHVVMVVIRAAVAKKRGGRTLKHRRRQRGAAGLVVRRRVPT